MKKVTFICNVCKEEYTREDAYVKKLILAFYVTRQYVTSDPNTHEYELRDISAECDTHICKSCISGILKTNGKPT